MESCLTRHSTRDPRGLGESNAWRGKHRRGKLSRQTRGRRHRRLREDEEIDFARHLAETRGDTGVIIVEAAFAEGAPDIVEEEFAQPDIAARTRGRAFEKRP